MSPRRLCEPEPIAEEIQKLLTVTTRVLVPWRVVLVQGAAREKLAAKFTAAFLKANADPKLVNADFAIRKLKAVFAAPACHHHHKLHRSVGARSRMGANLVHRRCLHELGRGCSGPGLAGSGPSSSTKSRNHLDRESRSNNFTTNSS